MPSFEPQTKNFKFLQLDHVPDRSEFRLNGTWYQKLTPSLSQESARNKNSKFNWLKVTWKTGMMTVAMLINKKDRITKFSARTPPIPDEFGYLDVWD